MRSRRAQKARILADLLERYEGPLTADFQRVYGLRLVDAVTDRTEEEILDLVFWLPDGSATMAMKEAGLVKDKARKHFGWTITQELNLALVNLTSYQTYAIAQGQSPRKIPVPKTIPGPSGEKPKKGQDASAIAHRLLAAQKGGP